MSHPRGLVSYGARTSIPARLRKNIFSRRHAGIGRPVPLIRQRQPTCPRPSRGDLEAKLSAAQRQSEPRTGDEQMTTMHRQRRPTLMPFHYGPTILALGLLLLTTVAATAQSWGRGGAYTGASPRSAYRPGSGVHRCTWSISGGCAAWRARGGKPAPGRIPGQRAGRSVEVR
jgi:hypothetical protein